ncbi:hypothetical protein ACWIFB_03730 [Dietzia sp. NPDC055340]
MRKTALVSAASALAAATIFAASGVAHAEDGEPAPTVDLDTPAGCVFIPTYTGVVWCMTLDAATAAVVAGSFGYGSLGTGSLADLISGLINTGSVVLSVGVPNSTGSYAPGSTGSYGPEASVGQLLTAPLASLGGAV